MQRSLGTTARLACGLLLAPLALAACSADDSVEPDPASTDDVVAAATAAPTGEPAPEAFAATAWRVVAEDGARYTTYLDADGTYRDLRNGDPWQTGSWSYSDGDGDKRLCFTPAAEGGVERCWEPGRMSGETMRAKGADDVTIELERVDYQPPAATETDDADDRA